MYSINCFIPIARVIMVASCGNPNVESFCVAWRKGLRRIWKLPSNSHCSLLPIISNCLLFSMNCVAVFLILLAPVLSTIVLLFDSSPIMEWYTLAAVRPSGKTFCIVSDDLIAPIIISFRFSQQHYKFVLC
jgi:hypothetical protein